MCRPGGWHWWPGGLEAWRAGGLEAGTGGLEAWRSGCLQGWRTGGWQPQGSKGSKDHKALGAPKHKVTKGSKVMPTSNLKQGPGGPKSCYSVASAFGNHIYFLRISAETRVSAVARSAQRHAPWPGCSGDAFSSALGGTTSATARQQHSDSTATAQRRGDTRFSCYEISAETRVVAVVRSAQRHAL